MSGEIDRKRYSGRGERGFALLLALLVLVVGATTFIMSGRTPTSDQSIRDIQRSEFVVENSVKALQVYSMSDDDRPGSLPCPDFTGNGRSDVNCLSTPGVIHLERLPWKTLGVSRESNHLWYAMDSDFRDHPLAEPINIELEGSLVLGDVSGYAALIIDPGDPLQGQDNRGSGSEAVDDYLDIEENTDGDNHFVDCRSLNGCNDRIVGISVNELFHLVQHRVLDKMKDHLEQFMDEAISGQGYLPFAAPLESSECESGRNRGSIPLKKGSCASDELIDPDNFPGWITENDWLDVAIYHVDDACTEVPCSAGDLSVDDKNKLTLVIALPGSPRNDQDRDGTSVTIDDYLESGIDDGRYINENHPRTNNDRYWGEAP